VFKGVNEMAKADIAFLCILVIVAVWDIVRRWIEKK